MVVPIPRRYNLYPFSEFTIITLPLIIQQKMTHLRQKVLSTGHHPSQGSCCDNKDGTELSCDLQKLKNVVLKLFQSVPIRFCRWRRRWLLLEILYVHGRSTVNETVGDQ
uniref:Uncharacterized protein n=1 Tax=Hyaloperonospora arabidopsidis (strain Emoy2) TaxID=559515 RepID=M4BGM8_HYAAE